MQFRRTAGRKVGIDIAPLVDVVFLLVIFFAVSTTFLETSGIQLELPASASSAEREAKEIAVFLGKDGSLSFEDEIISLDTLSERLQAVLADADRKVVVLRADKETDHGAVVDVMDLVKRAGAEALTVATRSGD